MNHYDFKLSAEEAVHLDGKVGPESQRMVDRAKEALVFQSSGLTDSQAAMAAKIMSVAREKKKLTFDRTSIKYCPCCKRQDGYFKHTRSGKYHRKGQDNTAAPRLFPAWNLDRGFVTTQNHIGTGFCDTCLPVVEPVIRALVTDMEIELPDAWQTVPHRYKVWPVVDCTACGWFGAECQMLRSTGSLGRDHQRCPSCHAENGWVHKPVVSRKNETAIQDKRSKDVWLEGVLTTSEEIQAFVAPLKKRAPPPS